MSGTPTWNVGDEIKKENEDVAGRQKEIKILHAVFPRDEYDTEKLDNPELAKRVHDEGHQLGIHTWSHPVLTKLPLDQADRKSTRLNSSHVMEFRRVLFRSH